MSEVATKKKRKYIDYGGGKKNKRKWWAANSRPKRGAPGVLLTCETGRERKCQREGLDILNYYLNASGNAGMSVSDSSQHRQDQEEDDAPTTLSLEEELKLLKSKKDPSESSGFGEYDTSCRGTVFVLCTLANCSLIPTIQTEYMLSKKNTRKISLSGSQTLSDNNSNQIRKNSGDEPNEKNQSDKIEKETSKRSESPSVSPTTDQKKDNATPLIQEATPWDPISTVRTILSDIDSDLNKEAPRSRFVTRMIPIQATCFASSEELKLTCSEVLKRYFSPTTKTFAIVFKRRNCSNLNRNLVIKIVGDEMSELFPDCKVKLVKPEATILVEVCGTLCGMSVVENIQTYRNFNLMGADVGSSQK
jgi:tRNA acetyltransferase TAN1